MPPGSDLPTSVLVRSVQTSNRLLAGSVFEPGRPHTTQATVAGKQWSSAGHWLTRRVRHATLLRLTSVLVSQSRQPVGFGRPVYLRAWRAAHHARQSLAKQQSRQSPPADLLCATCHLLWLAGVLARSVQTPNRLLAGGVLRKQQSLAGNDHWQATAGSCHHRLTRCARHATWLWRTDVLARSVQTANRLRQTSVFARLAGRIPRR